MWQSGERDYLENPKQWLMQRVGVNISFSKPNSGATPSWCASTPTLQRAFPPRCSDSLQDPHRRAPAESVPCRPGSPHRTLRVQFALCDPPSYHRRKAGRKGAVMLPPSTPASPSWCFGRWPAHDRVPPRNIYFLLCWWFFFFLLSPPEASFFMNKI